MVHRIEVKSKIIDPRAIAQKKLFESFGFSGRIKEVQLADVYTIDSFLEATDLEQVAALLANPVTEYALIDRTETPDTFSWAMEKGYLPGVSDNIGTTVRESIEDLLGEEKSAVVYTSQLFFVSGDLSKEEAATLADSLANPLIQRIHLKSYQEFKKDKGMEVIVPRVHLSPHLNADLVDYLQASDEELTIMGKQGIANRDGSRRGPLALGLTYQKTIQSHFAKLGRNPTDLEVEAIAQSWSEHCKHTIFADPLDEIIEGLFKTYIKGATERIGREKAAKGEKKIDVSVFTDNAGLINFDEKYVITFKVETHNSPTALDPFGGAITGILGVQRDTLGSGLGAKPFLNTYGFCFADPKDTSPLYRGAEFTQKMLSPQQIMEGVIRGVNVGGNCSGIATPQGSIFFDQRYKGKPLVLVGSLGIIPTETKGRKSHLKQAQPGDYIVMAGGRVGKDGIHGATFSSEALDSGSPATAVQIGDPITQKKLSDALVKEARDLGLYSSITDNGAGGLSCSVAEMAKESGGSYVKLNEVPLKYPGLSPWEIWISESQERMTLAVPPEKWNDFSALMKRRGVEATVIGEFTNSEKCVVDYHDQRVMDLELSFLHEGLPPRVMKSTYVRPIHPEPRIIAPPDLTDSLQAMMGRLNLASWEFISQQYDHEVQGGSVLKPLQGRGRVNGDAAITRPVLNSLKAVVVTQGINPTYSDIDTYHMAAAAIDTAIRNAVAAGAVLEHLAILDNFCWCSSDHPERLGQLKEALRASYETAVAFGTPFISGKDSMFNDFKGYDQEGNKVTISIPPTLLISAVGVMPNALKAVSLEAKLAGDLVYVLGETDDELGASEYFAMVGEQERGGRYIGNAVPKVDADKNKKLYQTLSQAIEEEIIASAQSVHRGGLAIALAKTSMGGKLGLDISLENLPGRVTRDDFALYSESQGRVVVTIAPQNRARFEELMQGKAFAQLGEITDKELFMIRGRKRNLVVETAVENLLQSYRARFERY